MKRTFKILFAAAILLQAAIVYAGDIRVMISPFDDSEGSDAALGRKAVVICAEEVMRSKGLSYVSPDDFIGAMTGDKETVKKGPPDLQKEYSAENRKLLEEMMDREKDKTDALGFLVKMLNAADIMMSGKAGRKGGLVMAEIRVDLMPRVPANLEDLSAVVECREEILDSELRKAMRGLLEKILKAGKVHADSMGEAGSSQVTYVVKALDGKYIAVEMTYEKGVPDPDIETVDIMPPEGIDENGRTIINVMSQEGRVINIEFDCKAGDIEGVTVGVPAPEGSKNAGRSESLTLKSEAGYLLVFDFEWKDDDSAASVKIGPKVNPFTGLEEKSLAT